MLERRRAGRCAAALAATLLASGCATRGSIAITCTGFAGYTRTLESSLLVSEIQSDAGQPISVLAADATIRKLDGAATAIDADDWLGTSLARLSADKSVGIGPSGAGDPPQPDAVLLLSGGGQWGAFGAGFLDRIRHRNDEYDPQFGVITGVSTGGLQSLFLAIGDDTAFEQLIIAYKPDTEREIVDRNKKWQTVVTGSLAGLKPLRKRIEDKLCTGGDPRLGCPMLESLAASGREVYIGFIRANDGAFLYADAKAIAKSAGTGDDAVGYASRRNARDCLTGVALASAAMPVFFQQVQINRETYYDGGVRQSVFEANLGDKIERGAALARDIEAKRAQQLQQVPRNIPSPVLYVVRNGPTQLLGKDISADEDADALTAAFRAEAIVVNQLEVGSIAALRLARPTGTIRLVTADGWDRFVAPGADKPCFKPPEVMFDPSFMRCLQAFGRAKAERKPPPKAPWIELSELEFAPKP